MWVMLPEVSPGSHGGAALPCAELRGGVRGCLYPGTAPSSATCFFGVQKTYGPQKKTHGFLDPNQQREGASIRAQGDLQARCHLPLAPRRCFFSSLAACKPEPPPMNLSLLKPHEAASPLVWASPPWRCSQLPGIIPLLSDLLQTPPPLVKHSRFLNPGIQLLNITRLRYGEDISEHVPC